MVGRMEVETGNGAREALIKYWNVAFDNHEVVSRYVDDILAYLWVEGYKIVSVEKTGG